MDFSPPFSTLSSCQSAQKLSPRRRSQQVRACLVPTPARASGWMWSKACLLLLDRVHIQPESRVGREERYVLKRALNISFKHTYLLPGLCTRVCLCASQHPAAVFTCCLSEIFSPPPPPPPPPPPLCVALNSPPLFARAGSSLHAARDDAGSPFESKLIVPH